MSAVVELLRPILFKFLLSCHTKKLVCDMVDAYVKTTDNDIDNAIAGMVRSALLKECK